MALILQADLEALGQVDFGNEPDTAVTLYIAAAQAAVEGYCGRSLERQVGRVDTLDGTGMPLIGLPLYPVETVASVVEDGDTLTVNEDFLLYPERGALLRLDGSTDREWWWDWRRQSVVVTYTAGYADGEAFPVPDDLRWVIANVALRLFKAEAAWAASPAAATGNLASLTLDGVGSYSYSQPAPAAVTGGQSGQAAAGSSPALTPGEKLALSRYRRRHIAGSYKPVGRY